MYLGTEPCSPPCIYSVQRRILLLFCILSLRVSIKVKIMSMSMCWVCRQQIYVCLEPYCCTASTHTFAIKYVWGAVYCLSKAENCVQPEQTIDTLLYPYSVFQFFLFIFFFRSVIYLSFRRIGTPLIKNFDLSAHFVMHTNRFNIYH